MAVLQSLRHPQQMPPKIPPSNSMQRSKTPVGALKKARPERDLQSPLSQPSNAHRLPANASYVTRDVDLFAGTSESSEEISSPTESQMADFLTIPPFTAPQIQMILWFSWTTTATPSHIAAMHNRAFTKCQHTMSRWNVINIENDVATSWHERGRSFAGMEPMSLLVPPGDNNSWSCLCDFGVDNCWEYKRDEESGENLEKLSMARMLWDATPRELVRCPHGRGKPRDGGPTAALASKPSIPSILRRLGALLPVPARWLRNFGKFWIVVGCGYSIFEMSFQGWISVYEAQSLLCAWFIGTVWLLTTWIDFGFVILVCSFGWLDYGMHNSSVPPSFKTQNTVLTYVSYFVYLLGPGIRAGTLKMMQTSVCALWAWLAIFIALDVNRDLGTFPAWVGLSFALWLLREVNWPMALKTRSRWR